MIRAKRTENLYCGGHILMEGEKQHYNLLNSTRLNTAYLIIWANSLAHNSRQYQQIEQKRGMGFRSGILLKRKSDWNTAKCLVIFQLLYQTWNAELIHHLKNINANPNSCEGRCKYNSAISHPSVQMYAKIISRIYTKIDSRLSHF